MFNKERFVAKNFNKIKAALSLWSCDDCCVTKKDITLTHVIVKDTPCEILPDGETAVDLNTAALLLTADKKLK